MNWKHGTYRILQIKIHCHKADHITVYSQKFLIRFDVSVATEILIVEPGNLLYDIQSRNPKSNLNFPISGTEMNNAHMPCHVQLFCTMSKYWKIHKRDPVAGKW
jgi:hypothetical protein